jgi:hypothetical protein
MHRRRCFVAVQLFWGAGDGVIGVVRADSDRVRPVTDGLRIGDAYAVGYRHADAERAG